MFLVLIRNRWQNLLKNLNSMYICINSCPFISFLYFSTVFVALYPYLRPFAHRIIMRGACFVNGGSRAPIPCIHLYIYIYIFICPFQSIFLIQILFKIDSNSLCINVNTSCISVYKPLWRTPSLLKDVSCSHSKLMRIFSEDLKNVSVMCICINSCPFILFLYFCIVFVALYPFSGCWLLAHRIVIGLS